MAERIRPVEESEKVDDAKTIGRLDGMTIIRYAHAYDSGGGVERYLEDLNRVLLDRNRMTIVQVQMTSDSGRVGEEQSKIGAGRFVRISLFVSADSHAQAIAGPQRRSDLADRCRRWVTDNIFFSSAVYPWLSYAWLKNRSPRRRPGEPNGVGQIIRSLCERFSPDLICLHAAGGADAAEAIDTAIVSGIPTAVVHHFSNDRLGGLSMREQLRRMTGVAGVNAAGVPDFLRAQFVNVADGIDTEYFRREYAQRPPTAPVSPIIFLPARLTPTKGQADVLRAVAELKRRGSRVGCVFAGRTDSTGFFDQLRLLVQREALEEEVRFVGELGPAELRNWYGVARIVAFPTRHHEGLSRILLECQAMGVPPVAYDVGGASEAICHGETGFLLKVGDFEGLVSSIERLLHDDLLHQRMASAGRTLVERRFSLQALCKRHEDFYTSVLETWQKNLARVAR